MWEVQCTAGASRLGIRISRISLLIHLETKSISVRGTSAHFVTDRPTFLQSSRVRRPFKQTLPNSATRERALKANFSTAQEKFAILPQVAIPRELFLDLREYSDLIRIAFIYRSSLILYRINLKQHLIIKYYQAFSILKSARKCFSSV